MLLNNSRTVLGIVLSSVAVLWSSHCSAIFF